MIRPARLARIFVGAATLSAALIVMTGSPAGATDVSDEAGLRAAYADTAETQIDLTADIDLTDCTANGGDLDRGGATAVTIDGHGFTITQTCADERVIENNGTESLTLESVTITGGDVTGSNGGGGVFGSGGAPVILNNTTVVGNSAPSTGGGGVNADHLEMNNSTLADNHADDFGGGANVVTATITNSTISGNDSDVRAGGIGGSEITLVNSTVSGNSAGRDGGGVFVFTVNLVNSTILGNAAANDSANLYFETELDSFGSVVASPEGAAENCGGGGTIASKGYNFDDEGTCGLDEPTDVDSGDPGLGALADNGGPTLTHLPLEGSPLIEVIPPDVCEVDTDQRGISRPQGQACEIGSVEVEVPTPTEPPPPPPATPVSVTPQFTG